AHPAQPLHVRIVGHVGAAHLVAQIVHDLGDAAHADAADADEMDRSDGERNAGLRRTDGAIHAVAASFSTTSAKRCVASVLPILRRASARRARSSGALNAAVSICARFAGVRSFSDTRQPPPALA